MSGENLVRAFLFSALYAISAIFFSTHAGSSRYVIYKVKPGDALERIAKRYRVSQSSIKRWNRIRSANRIYAGQKLRIFLSEKKEQRLGPPPGFAKPAPRFKVIRGFDSRGDRRNYGWLGITGKGRKVYASASGKVIKVAYRPKWGKYILVDHGKGWLTMYSHLEKILVKRGERIKKRQTIALSKKRKLFFLIARNGVPVNPGYYF